MFDEAINVGVIENGSYEVETRKRRSMDETGERVHVVESTHIVNFETCDKNFIKAFERFVEDYTIATIVRKS